MATTEMHTAGTEGEQKEKLLTPSEVDATPVLNGSSAPLNFSDLTPCQFGISAQSFIPSSSGCKSTSRLAQIKARRRSSVGVRGSPETNSLIRFMAQQRMKTPPARQTSEVPSILRQKMVSFQSMMAVGETEVCDLMPRQDSDSGGCIKTRDHLSDGNSLGRGKENNPSMMTPTPSKRRCLGPLEGCDVEIREASSPIIHFTLKEQEDNAFELQSLSRTPSDDPAASSPSQFATPIHISSLHSQLEMEPKENDDSTGAFTNKKKSVRFGGPLSPELFDKTLPPSIPLQKGGAPAQVPTPGGTLRSVLKTPQRKESQVTLTRPDLSSPTVFGASPVLAMSRKSRMTSVENDDEDKDRKIFFPSMEEIDSVVMSGTEDTWETQPLNLNITFHEEFLSQMVTEYHTKPSTTSQIDILAEPATFADEERQCDSGAEASAPVKSRNRRKVLPGRQHESTGVVSARSSRRKRKQPEEGEPVKRLTRSAAMLASGKIKISSTSMRRWNKDVDLSLYSSRKYASKNPTLSPITEKLSFISQSPAQETPSAVFTAVTDQKTCLNPEMAKDTLAVDEHTLANAFENPSEGSVTSPHSNKESTTGKVARLSWPRFRGRRWKIKKVSVFDCDLLNDEPQHQAGGDTEELWKGKSRETFKASNKIPLEHAVPEQGGVDVEPNGQTSADTSSTDSDRTSECHTNLSVCPASDEDLHYTLNVPPEPAQRLRERKSSVRSSNLLEQGDKAEHDQLSCRVEENGQVEQASSSDSQEDQGVPNLHLAPWQADFNFEDMFKPVSTRGHRSVRRSLRNQSNAGHSNNSAGLSWMPWTSPDSSEELRRRTRGRRLSAVLPLQPLFPEGSQDDAS